jgi:hypothetical protein
MDKQKIEDSKTAGKSGRIKDWKIVRSNINSCIVIRTTAFDPSRPELLGTYTTEAGPIKLYLRFRKRTIPIKGDSKCANRT